MRALRFNENFVLLVCLSLTCFCIFDEEPVFDYTDLNLLHVVLFAVSLCVVIAELVTRARFGHFTYKDVVSLLAAMAFWQQLDNYVRALLFIFAIHALTPLELDLLELTEAYHVSASWVAFECCPMFFFLSVAFGSIFSLNLNLRSARRPFILMYLIFLVSWLLGILIVLVWDSFLSGLSAWTATADTAAFYAQPKTTQTYDATLAVRDQFEWHREKPYAAVLRFDDLYFFLFRLSLVYSLTMAVGVWLFILIDFARSAIRPLSYTAVAVGALWLEHAVFASILPCALVAFTGLRLLARTVFETAGF